MNTFIIKQKSKFHLITLSLFISFQFTYAQKFVIPILPDTQYEISDNQAMFTSQINWIANNKILLNIPIVLHVGDIINWQTPDQYMWKIASKGFRILDSSQIPYALAVGNYDCAAIAVGGGTASGNVIENLRDTREVNEFFPVVGSLIKKAGTKVTKVTTPGTLLRQVGLSGLC